MRPTATHSPDDIDFATFWQAIVDRRIVLTAAVIVVGGLTFGFLSMLTPRYASTAEVLISREEARSLESLRVDADDVANQVELIRSPDLLARVARELELEQNPEFNAALRRKTLPDKLLQLAGFGGNELRMSEEERVLVAFEQRLQVDPVADSHVISIEASSAGSELASRIANTLAKAYIESTQLGQLRKESVTAGSLGSKIAEMKRDAETAETALDSFRANAGLLAGQSNATLDTQQLAELNGQLTVARASRSEAEARARIVGEMLSAGEIDASPEVLKSTTIQRLLEGRIQIERRLAELSATLLPGHPRMRQLYSELATLKSQLQSEGQKIVRGIQREVTVATAREQTLERNLETLTGHSARSREAQARLGVLDQEARSKRALFESHLDRFNEASTHSDHAAVPALARLISTARPSAIPAFPKTVPITLLAMAATLMLGLGLIGMGDRVGRNRRHRARHALGPAKPIDMTPSPGRSVTPQPILLLRSCAAVAAQLDQLAGERPDLRTLLSAAGETGEPATEPLQIARLLASKSVPVLLIDLSAIPTGLAGFGDLVAGSATFEDTIEADSLGSAHLMGAGNRAIDSFDVGQLAAAEAVLDALEGIYAHVIITAEPEVATRLLSAIKGQIDAGVLLERGPAAPSLGGSRDFLGFQNPPFAVIRLECAGPRAGAMTGITARLRRDREPLRQ